MKTTSTFAVATLLAAAALLASTAAMAAAGAYESLEFQMARGMTFVPATATVATTPAREQRSADPSADSLEQQMARGMNWQPGTGTTLGNAVAGNAPAAVAKSR